MDKHKAMVLAACMGFGKNKYPNRDLVQQAREKPNLNTLKAIATFFYDGSGLKQPDMKAIRQWHKKFRTMTDDDLLRHYPNLTMRYNVIPPGVKFRGDGDYRKTARDRTSRHTLAETLNKYNKKIGRDRITNPARYSKAQLEKMIRSAMDATARWHIQEAEKILRELGRTVMMIDGKLTNGATAVAEGAYETDREAAFKTGYTPRGESKQRTAHKRRTAKFIERESRRKYRLQL